MKLEEAKKEACKSCGRNSQERGSVSIRMTDPWHRYTGSGRAFVRTANSKMCKSCFKKFTEELKKLMIKY